MKKHGDWVWAAVLALTCILPTLTSAQIFNLTAGRLAAYKNLTGTKLDKATFKFLHDPEIVDPLQNPTCPSPDSTLTIRDDDEEKVFTLPCANWAAVGHGYRYLDRAGTSGIRLILFSTGRLII